MSAWRKEPPTHKEWLDTDNHGHWWVKSILSEEEFECDEDGNLCRWPEVWYTEVVWITDEMTNGCLEDGRLVARGGILKQFYLDDPEATRDLYWQPVAPALDDEKDKRPVVD